MRTPTITFLSAFLGLLLVNTIADSRSGSMRDSVRPGLPAPDDMAVMQSQVPATPGNDQLQVPSGLRLMVFSPHPDDETLAAGGLIQRVTELGGKVRVVFVTNGDGYAKGVRLTLKRAKTSSDDFIGYGHKRHDEAVRAISALGLKPEDGLFLGFPDQGIDNLWEYHWSKVKPYTSPYTRFSDPEYKTSYNRVVKYTGTDLDDEIERTIKDFAPDWVVLPDPRDDHPDHSASGVFVLDALRRLSQTRNLSLNSMQVFTYLVHYTGYPSYNGWKKLIAGDSVTISWTESRILSSTKWVSFMLSSEEVARKERALGAYETQLEVLGGLMKTFIRPAEVFGRLDQTRATSMPKEFVARIGRSSG